MPIRTQVLLHEFGPALWPEQRSLADIMALKRQTPKHIFEATYQLNPVPPEGTLFKRDDFKNSRYDSADSRIAVSAVARFQSWDTAISDREDAAYSAMVEGELWPDYRMGIRLAYRDHLDMPALVEQIHLQARRGNRDNKLRAVIIEAKASGPSAFQTLRHSAPAWLVRRLKAFTPTVDKPTRAGQAAVWCSNFSVLLPHPAENVPWLADFEFELFSVPAVTYWDQVDAFSQLVLYCENLLEAGLRARTELTESAFG